MIDRKRDLAYPTLTNVPKVPFGRSTAHIKSVDTGIGNAVKKEIPVYTGTAMKGIAQMSKSNAVPVFNDDHIIEIAKMRR